MHSRLTEEKEERLKKTIHDFKGRHDEFLRKALMGNDMYAKWKAMLEGDLAKVFVEIDIINTSHQCEINALVESVNYLKEVIQAQRKMMNDNLDRLLELEKKLASLE